MLKWNGLHNEITAHRNPTRAEINRGYGAIHYRTFDILEWLKKDGTIKQWIVADDGLRYYR